MLATVYSRMSIFRYWHYSLHYSLQDGAEVIYVIPQNADLATIQPPVNAVYETKHRALLVESQSTFLNLSAHFGCLTSSGPPQSRLKYSMCEMTRPAIQAVPSICSSIHKSRHPMKCDNTAPAVVLKVGLSAAVTLEDALYFQEAFWALPLISSPSGFGSKGLSLSLLVQKMLWKMGGNLMILNHSGYKESTRCDTDDGRFEVMRALDSVDCEGVSNMQCLMNLAAALKLEFPLFELQQRWIQMLKKLYANTFASNFSVTPLCETNVKYHPIVPSKRDGYLETSFKSPQIPNLERNVDVYRQVCKLEDDVSSLTSNLVNLAQPWTQFADVLLIVVFNNPLYDVIPYIELLYRSFFPLILYCGPRDVSPEAFPALKNYSFSFITYGDTPAGHSPGSFSYQCVTMAMDMHYKVSGYLTIADDMVVFPHKLATFPKHAVWFLSQKEIRIGELQKLRECRLGMCDFFAHWNWWQEYQIAALAVCRTLKQRQHSSYLINKCHRQLVLTNGDEFRLNGAYSDIFYIPSRLRDDFKPLAHLFLEHNVFVEIAIPSIVRCLENPEDIVALPGTTMWDLSRDETWLYWTAPNIVGKTYLHPTKWSYLYSANGTVQHKQVFCDHILPFMHDRFARFRAWKSG